VRISDVLGLYESHEVEEFLKADDKKTKGVHRARNDEEVIPSSHMGQSDLFERCSSSEPIGLRVVTYRLTPRCPSTNPIRIVVSIHDEVNISPLNKFGVG